ASPQPRGSAHAARIAPQRWPDHDLLRLRKDVWRDEAGQLLGEVLQLGEAAAPHDHCRIEDIYGSGERAGPAIGVARERGPGARAVRAGGARPSPRRAARGGAWASPVGVTPVPRLNPPESRAPAPPVPMPPPRPHQRAGPGCPPPRPGGRGLCPPPPPMPRG